MIEIVILDGYTMNPGDLSWEELEKLGKLTIYDRTLPEEVMERSKNATVIITNKVVFTKEIIKELPLLQLICVAATGYNSIDVKAAGKFGVKVCNVVGYAAASVAQHVFAQILRIRNDIYLHNLAVQEKKWSQNLDWSFTEKKITELSGQTMGIYGLGAIGSKVAEIALAFGMKVIATRKDNTKPTLEGVKLVEFEKLLQKSDIISLHAPLSEENAGIFNETNIAIMKSSAILVNTGRGGLINEEELKWALENNKIAYAALDVLTTEPPPEDHPLFGLDNCIITPHMAWASFESRQRLLHGVVQNVWSYLDKPNDFEGITS